MQIRQQPISRHRISKFYKLFALNAVGVEESSAVIACRKGKFLNKSKLFLKRHTQQGGGVGGESTAAGDGNGF